MTSEEEKYCDLYTKYFNVIRWGNKIPRKAKKVLFGRKLNKTKLKKLLKQVVIIKNEYPDPATILPYPFCPKCGCILSTSTGNMATYPESYEKNHCVRCGHLVAMQDNSPWMHCLEFPENNYHIDW